MPRTLQMMHLHLSCPFSQQCAHLVPVADADALLAAADGKSIADGAPAQAQGS